MERQLLISVRSSGPVPRMDGFPSASQTLTVARGPGIWDGDMNHYGIPVTQILFVCAFKVPALTCTLAWGRGSVMINGGQWD